MTIVKYLVVALGFSLVSGITQARGPQCTDDIKLVSGEGCSAPCCYQDPPNSGHYNFKHSAVEKIDIRNNPASVVSVSFPNLQSMEKTARISHNQPGAITSISFPALRTTGGLDMSNNPGLEAIDLPNLLSIDNEDYDAYLRIQSNPALAILNVPLLNTVSSSSGGTAYVQLRYNAVLESIDLPKLKTLESTDEDEGEAYVFIDSNDAVTQISMNNLKRLVAGNESISYLLIFDMPNLESIGFAQLTELLPADGEYNFNELTVLGTPKLTSFEFPMLERVSLLQLANLTGVGTTEAKFPRLSDVDYLWGFSNCESTESSLKMYICTDQVIGDIYLSGALCGEAGYMLYTPNYDNRATCDSSHICQSFIPDPPEFVCTGSAN